MLQRLLVPLDGSPLAAGVLRGLPALILPGQELDLLRVEAPDPRRPHEEERRREAASIYLEERRAELEVEGWRVRVHVGIGDPSTVILDLATRHPFDAVAMSTHGAGARPAARGSVSERVLRACPLPVYLANSHSQKPLRRLRRILVPLDGSGRSARILHLVVPLARAHGARVSLFHVVSRDLPREVGTSHPAAEPTRGHRRSGPGVLSPFARHFRDRGIDTWVMSRYGDPARAILAASDGADLVALTTHGRGGVGRWFGSVARLVLRKCTAPLLVLRVAMPAGLRWKSSGALALSRPSAPCR